MNDQRENFDLRRFASILRHRWRWVFVPLMMVLVLAAGVTAAKPKQYDATVIMLAGQGEGIADVTAIDAINKATQTLARMGTNRIVIEQALRDLKLQLELDVVEVTRSTRASVPVNTQQIEITVRNEDPERATQLANGIGRAFSAMVEESAGKDSRLSATVWQPAIVPEAPAAPNVPMNLALGFLFGLALGVAAALLREQLDQAWKGEEELEELLGVPVLAAIPEMSAKSRRERVYA